MDHTRAQQIFEEIQARPYGLSLAPNVPSNNCYYKGVELLQRLGVLGYAVRGRVGETFWDKNLIPEHVVNLILADLLTTHFYVEVMVDNEWRIVDPSFQPNLAKYGFYIGAWEGTPRSCFEITKLYTQEESIAYQEQWFNPDYADDFFKRGGQAWSALNTFFQELK